MGGPLLLDCHAQMLTPSTQSGSSTIGMKPTQLSGSRSAAVTLSQRRLRGQMRARHPDHAMQAMASAAAHGAGKKTSTYPSWGANATAGVVNGVSSVIPPNAWAIGTVSTAAAPPNSRVTATTPLTCA